jgi:YbbR domain-containing protein
MSNNKTVGVKAKINGSPKSGYYVSNVSVDPPTVDITGSPEVLSGVDFVETFAIDVTNASSDISRNISLDVKSGEALEKGSPAQVNVKIKFSQSDTSKEMPATIITKNLDPSLYATTINPNLVKVIVSGPAGTINNLKSSDIVLTLDFQDKKASQPGTYNFDINSKNFIVPIGISVISIVPSSVYVSVDKKSS